MRNFLKYIAFGLTLVFVLSSCENLMTAKQDVEPVISPDKYPTATYTTDFSGSAVTEGDTITYTITTNKMLDQSVTFHLTQTAGDADESDYIAEAAVLQPYTTETSMQIVFPSEGLVESEETATLTLAPTSVSDKYLLNPNTQHPTLDLTVANLNDPTLLTINMYWDDENDNDFAIWSDTETYPATEWSWDGATTAFPEIDMTVWLSDPPGSYYVSIFDWGNPSFNYTFVFGFPDGSMETIEGFFDVDNLSQYTERMFLGAYATYDVIKINNDGSKFTVSAL